jgi:hypothetical protein
METIITGIQSIRSRKLKEGNRVEVWLEQRRRPVTGILVEANRKIVTIIREDDGQSDSFPAIRVEEIRSLNEF